MLKIIFCRRIGDSDITVTPSVSAWTDYSSDIIMQLIQLLLQQHWLFLMTWGRNINLHHPVQCKWNWWKTVGTEEKLGIISQLKKGEPSVTYIGYPESKFRWAIKKNKNILQTMHIAIWCTYCTLLFNIVSTIHEALVIALHQFLYPFTVEWCCLLCKARGKSYFDLIGFVKPLASKVGFKMQ